MERYEGTGTLTGPDNRTVPVRYYVEVRQEMIEPGIPGLKSASGSVTFKFEHDGTIFDMLAQTLTLKMENGQWCNCLIRTYSPGSNRADVVVSGPINDK